jgi:hypothetical protein
MSLSHWEYPQSDPNRKWFLVLWSRKVRKESLLGLTVLWDCQSSRWVTLLPGVQMKMRPG